MFVNSLPFVVSVSQRIKFTMLYHVPNITETILLTSTKKIFKMYQHRDNKDRMLPMDRDFGCIRKKKNECI